MRLSHHSALILSLVSGLGLVGCGGDDPAPAVPTPTAGAGGVAGASGSGGASGGKAGAAGSITGGAAGVAGVGGAAGQAGMAAGGAAGAPGGAAGAAGAVGGSAGASGGAGAAGLGGAAGQSGAAGAAGLGGAAGAAGAGAGGAMAGSGGGGTGGAAGLGGAGGESAEGTLCSGTAPCPSDFVCATGRCVPAAGPCAKDSDCSGDTYCCGADCTVGAPRCVPYGKGPRGDFDPACVQGSAAAGYEPIVQCEWAGPDATDAFPSHKQMLSTVVAAPLPIGAGVSLVAVTSNCLESASPAAPGVDPNCFGVLRIFAAGTCALRTTIDDPNSRIVPTTAPAIGDLDADGGKNPEIVAVRIDGGLVAYRWNPGASKYVTFWTADVSSTINVPRLDGPSLHDLDHDGFPEVILGFDVYDGRTGNWLNASQPMQSVSAPIVVNLPPSGDAHLFAGGAYKWNVAAKQWVLAYPAPPGQVAQSAAIDFGTPGSPSTIDSFDFSKGDGIPEIVSITPLGLRVHTLEGVQIYSGTLGSRGAPAIGDFDGDGLPEFAVPDTGGSFALADPGCRGGAAGCLSSELRWNKSVEDDGYDTASSAFDFNGDGRAEIIHADQCFVRIHDGKTGETMFSAPRQSCTYGEYPTPLDVDGDGSGELVVPSNALCSPTCIDADPADPGLRCEVAADCRSNSCEGGYCRCTKDSQCPGETRCLQPKVMLPPGGKTCRTSRAAATVLPTTGFRVYRDALDRWAAPRAIWNQHAFSGTNIDDAGSVPAKSIANVSSLRATTGTQGLLPAADVTVRFASQQACRFAKGASIFQADICNRGPKPIPPGISATIYSGDPALNQVLCIAKAAGAIAPGTCAPITCQLVGGLVGAITLQANDDALHAKSIVECSTANNRDTLVVPPGGCPVAAQ